MSTKRFTGWLVLAGLLAVSSPALAFTRGLTGKVRALQSQAYEQRLANAKEAYRSRDFKKSVQEALLALKHAGTPEKASPVHELLAAAYTRLNDRESAARHLSQISE